MVTTTSLTPDLRFTVYDLLQSPAPEDKDLAEATIQVVQELVSKLKPILHYICQPMGAMHVVHITKRTEKVLVGLNQDGQFVVTDYRGNDPNVQLDEAAWHYATFEQFLDDLKGVLQMAEEKREKHLVAVAKRREMLNGIVALVKGSAQ